MNPSRPLVAIVAVSLGLLAGCAPRMANDPATSAEPNTGETAAASSAPAPAPSTSAEPEASVSDPPSAELPSGDAVCAFVPDSVLQQVSADLGVSGTVEPEPVDVTLIPELDADNFAACQFDFGEGGQLEVVAMTEEAADYFRDWDDPGPCPPTEGYPCMALNSGQWFAEATPPTLVQVYLYPSDGRYAEYSTEVAAMVLQSL